MSSNQASASLYEDMRKELSDYAVLSMFGSMMTSIHNMETEKRLTPEQATELRRLNQLKFMARFYQNPGDEALPNIERILDYHDYGWLTDEQLIAVIKLDVRRGVAAKLLAEGRKSRASALGLS